MSLLKLKMLIKSGYLDFRDFGIKIGLARMGTIWHNESIASLQRKNQTILEKLENDYGYLLQKYQNIPESVLYNDTAPIWMLWWEGKMPPIIELCYKSVVRHAGRHPVILLSKKNIREYVSLPDSVWNQLDNGQLRIAHLADMIRVHLIRRYGGLWLDASIYCSREIPEDCFSLPVYSMKGVPDRRYVSNNQWTTFVIGGYRENVLCSFLDDFFLEYSKSGKRFIDYFMFDCAIALAYKHIPTVRKSIDNLPVTQGDFYWLNQHLDLSCSENYRDGLPVFSKIGWQKYTDKTPKTGRLYYELTKEEMADG